MERRCGCRRNIDFLPYIFQCSKNGNKILLPLKYLTSCVLFMCVILVMDNACVYRVKYLLLVANPVRKSSLPFLRLLFRTAKCTAESTQSLMLMFSDTCGPRTSNLLLPKLKRNLLANLEVNTASLFEDYVTTCVGFL